MRKNGKNKSAVGIYLEGSNVICVKIIRDNGTIRVVDALTYRLDTSLPANEPEQVSGKFSDTDGEINIESEDYSAAADSGKTGVKESDSANIAVLTSIFSDFMNLKYKSAFSITEPKVYYTNFNSDWGLKNRKLTLKVVDELSKMRIDNAKIKSDAVGIIYLPNKRITAVVREGKTDFLDTFDKLKRQGKIKLPAVSFVETLEVSLVNLAVESYSFTEDQKNVIIYVGEDFSRIIFLQGNKLYQICQLISDGHSSSKIANTVYSRLLFESDTLNYDKLDNIILCGRIENTNLKDLLTDSFASEANVEVLNSNRFDLSELLPETLSRLPEYAPALGAALRVLEPENENLIDVNLMPQFIKSGQKAFKLGLIGYLLVGAIGLSLFYSITINAERLSTLNAFKRDLFIKKAKMIEYNELVEKLGNLQNEVAIADASLKRIETLTLGSKTYSDFLSKIVLKADIIGHIWITDAFTIADNKLQLMGYSLYRNRIYNLANSLENASLQKVDVLNIREKNVYKFSLTINLTPK